VARQYTLINTTCTFTTKDNKKQTNKQKQNKDQTTLKVVSKLLRLIDDKQYTSGLFSRLLRRLIIMNIFWENFSIKEQELPLYSPIGRKNLPPLISSVGLTKINLYYQEP